MNIRPLIHDAEVAEAYAAFASRVYEEGQTLKRLVGYQGGSEEVEFIWHADKNLWAVLEPDWIPNRYWCAFGIENPHPVSMLSITCEINPPRGGINRRCAGLFLRDKEDAIYLAHSGKVGGGRSGIGKTAFINSRNNGDVISVSFPDGQNYDYIVIGCVGDVSFVSNLARFVHSVATFKQAATSGKG